MIINIYKERGWTSFDVVAKLRGVLHTRRIGHAGTLDPAAEGVLVVLTEQDTKKQNDFLSYDKEYIAKIAFGVDSPTYDLDSSEISFVKGANLDLMRIQSALSKFIGDIDQTVPPYSAVKVKGKKLYDLARNNLLTHVDLPIKRVHIYKIDIIDFVETEILIDEKLVNLPILSLKVVCGSGTYIRSLAHDLGQYLNTSAVLTSLLRTRIGVYKLEDAVKIAELVQPL